MKKLLLLSLIAVILCSFLISCNSTTLDKFTASEEISNQESLISFDVESFEPSDSSLFSDDDEKSIFTKEEAQAYFTPVYPDMHPSLDFSYTNGEGLSIPFSQLDNWIAGSSDITFTGVIENDEPISIYDLLSNQFYTVFKETTFYGIRLNGKKMALNTGIMNCFNFIERAKDTVEPLYENIRSLYFITYVFEESDNTFNVSFNATILHENNKYYATTLGSISELYRTIGLKLSDAEIKTVKLFNQSTNKYYDVEAICGKSYINFIFNKYIIEITFDSDFEITDDILDNIVIMDLLEEYSKIQ